MAQTSEYEQKWKKLQDEKAEVRRGLADAAEGLRSDSPEIRASSEGLRDSGTALLDMLETEERSLILREHETKTPWLAVVVILICAFIAQAAFARTASHMGMPGVPLKVTTPA
jgi:hypothetical protein